MATPTIPAQPLLTTHLQTALEIKKIRVYSDDKNLPRGEVIWIELMKAIESSRIAVVFLKNYMLLQSGAWMS